MRKGAHGLHELRMKFKQNSKFSVGPMLCELFHALFEPVVNLISYNICVYPDTVRLRDP